MIFRTPQLSLLLAIVAISLMMCTPSGQDGDEQEVRPVGGDIARLQEVKTIAEVAGQLRGANQAPVLSGAGGSVNEIRMLPGEEVKSGDVIVTLNQTVLRGPVGYQDYKVTAPIDGLLVEMDVQQGQFVHAQQEIGWVVAPGDLEALIRISDRFNRLVNAGDEVTFTELNTGQSYQGQVTSKSSVADPDTQDIVVRCRFSRDDSDLMPGMYGDFEIVVDRKLRLTIPQDALRIEDENTYVFVVDPTTYIASRVEIQVDETIETEDFSYVVTGGLDEGRFVVTQGEVFDGDSVRIRQSIAFFDEARDQRVAAWQAESRGEQPPTADASDD